MITKETISIAYGETGLFADVQRDESRDGSVGIRIRAGDLPEINIERVFWYTKERWDVRMRTSSQALSLSDARAHHAMLGVAIEMMRELQDNLPPSPID